MDSKTRYMLLKTVQDDNILPVTSICNMTCRFCSHRGNPEDLKVYSFGHLSMGLIRELLGFLPAEGPVIMGESATRIIEGDPFTHPHFSEILKLLRRHHPEKLIKITTNGSYLTGNRVELLDKIKPLELNISLNCSSPEERAFLMGDKDPGQVFEGLELLVNKEIAFNGSIVAMPHLTGWESLKKTIGLLAGFHPETVRVFFPGFTRYSPEELKFEPDLYQDLREYINKLASEYSIPIILEPPYLKDLFCRVKGIIPGSRAARSLIKRGDIIISINNKRVISRVDGFNRLVKNADPLLEVKRGEKQQRFKLPKEGDEKPGVVVDYDLEPVTIKRLESNITDVQDRSVVIITSVSARFLMEYVINEITAAVPQAKVDLLPVRNNFFGGSIVTAGLLVNQDIISALKEKNKKYDLIILPRIIYDSFGNDLTGKSYKIIAEKMGGQIEII